MARTGSGKTCAFLIPLVEKLRIAPKGEHGNHVRGIILSPTRELSMQTLKVFHKLVRAGFGNSPEDHHHESDGSISSMNQIRAVGIHGGEGMEKQFDLLASKPDVIIATPGRLAHHLTEIPDFTLSGCQMCILDEADRLLEMGFAMQIRQIARTLPETCQKVLLSATMPKILIEFTKSGFALDPTVVRLDNEASVSAELRVAFITCRSLDKDAAFLHILHHIEQDRKDHAQTRTGLTLVFAATRYHVEYLTTLLLASGISATMIYGSLDLEARKSNLAAFRGGHKPVLVVTDVAARGIDVPLIDHVVHYHFPPSPKLFVHRSGRAARAGRIGFCWGLVEPDELPYMIDLHLFLGRKPNTGVDCTTTDGVAKHGESSTYTLDEMTPDMVHYGSLPESVITEEVENVQRILNSEMSGSLDAEALRSLTKVCRNAMQQYRRTRAEASREGVRRAKDILEGERLETGQRVGGGAIPPHPLLRGMEMRRLSQGRGTLQEGISSLDNHKKREDFLRDISSFRPKETVFEAFATGGGKDIGVKSQIDKGRTSKNKRYDSSTALKAMKEMRRQMRITRNKGSALVVAGSETAMALNGLAENTLVDGNNDDSDDDELVGSIGDDEDGNVVESRRSEVPVQKPATEGKRWLSKAEKRRLKKNQNAALELPHATLQREEAKKKEVVRDFRDPVYYIDNDFTSNPEEADRARKIEAAMQPSHSSSSWRGTMGAALRLEEAMLDLVGDENEELVKKQRLMRWDKSKRKYVKTTVGEELSGESKTKKMRVESGQLVKNDRAKLGELYAKWQKKTNRSVGRTGVFDDDDGGDNVPVSAKRSKSKAGNKGYQGEKGDKVKTATEIKKEREKQHNMKMKNMKKGDRRVVERKQRTERNATARKERNRGAGRVKR